MARSQQPWAWDWFGHLHPHSFTFIRASPFRPMASAQVVHLLVDTASSGLSELRERARSIVRAKISSPYPGVLALTVLGSSTTNNTVSAQGLPGYDHIESLHKLKPFSSCTAILDSLDGLKPSDGPVSDLFKGLVVAVFSLNAHAYAAEGAQQWEGAMSVHLFCDASRYTDDVDEEDFAEVVEQIDELGIRCSVASSAPLPETGVLHALSVALGERFEFSQVESAEVKVEAEAEAEMEAEAEAEAEAEMETEAGAREDKPEVKHEVKNEAEQAGRDAEQAEPQRVDPTDGNAYTREAFIEFYGGTEEWEAANDVATVGLARRALRAHRAWSQLDKEKQVLRCVPFAWPPPPFELCPLRTSEMAA